ncbi:acyltransferase family protein [Listeria ivanovii]|uniref:acyltransferase family protein n=1 Tax=Listeria ivanovii TaxID=1638 RepID=UPI00190D9734|nr:acyltransferase family protein [Listeria ivanovii]MBK3913210.1 acyltransferase family protein [Listeria ivanovii subsp. ivanovii]MBK3920673.1 acyltransferase family protein [Listeria ivanovii subsp. ivanovii]MBK3925501.1 acyltransferase family protein [Listeria ivanovii subsp. ivanovii]
MVNTAEKRESYFDNAKFILIFLVVFGHFLQTFIAEYASVRVLYIYIYTFHMPAFILISGFFAKSFGQPGYLKKMMKNLILPYAFFQLIYSIFYYFLLNKENLSIKFLDPEWSLWFLLSLFFWNLMLLVFAKLKPWKSVTLALLIGLLAGYFDVIGGYLSLSRTLVFFPFFLVGFFLTKEHFYFLKTHFATIFSWIFIIILLIFIAMNPNLNDKWFLGSKPYGNFVEVKSLGLFIRFLVYFISFCSIAAFFSLVPRKRLFFTKWGKNTLYVYLLHGFFIKFFREGSQTEFQHSPTTFFLLFATTFALTVLLSSRLVKTVVQPVIELRTSMLHDVFSRLAKRESY